MGFCHLPLWQMWRRRSANFDHKRFTLILAIIMNHRYYRGRVLLLTSYPVCFVPMKLIDEIKLNVQNHMMNHIIHKEKSPNILY